MNRIRFPWSVAVAFAIVLSVSADTVELASLDLSLMSAGDGKVTVNANVYGEPITVGGERFAKGVGTHAASRYELEVTGGECLSFSAKVGLDNSYPAARAGTVQFRVRADGRPVASSPVLSFGDKAVELKADLKGAKTVGLEVSDTGDGVANDIAAWIDAKFEVTAGTRLVPIVPKGEQLGILTPPAPESPRINPPRIFGARPGHPILFTLPVSGVRPMRYSVAGLPEGATFDAATGRLGGSVAKAGDYKLVFTAENAKGRDTREFRLVIGDRIALTPPMGWNSWNCFAAAVTEKDIRGAADALAKSGLMDYGWSYVNIDDFWQNHVGDNPAAQDIKGPLRHENGSFVVNKRFGDLKRLTDYVHGLGLKIGIYSSPGPTTCGNCAGSWMHEAADAKQFADWGFDYLKYDWCSYGGVAVGTGLKRIMAPYQLMGRELAKQPRDIVYSLCQYGMGNVSTWGASVGGQCWRTTDDIRDVWGGVLSISGQQDGLERFAGPGAWNDADMLVVGLVGWGPKLHPSRLTPNEQYTHVTLWAMTASPLLIGCDLTRIDDFTRGLLTNPEVLEVSQDVKGAAAARILCDGWNEGAWARPLADGGVAVALVNLSSQPRRITLDLAKDLGLCGTWTVRDLWRMRDLGTVTGTFASDVLVHACTLVKLTPGKGAGLLPGVGDCRERAWRRLFDGRTESGARGCAGCN